MKVALVAVWAVALSGTAMAQIQGRVIAGGAEQVNVLVSLETFSGQIVHQAYTSARGNFRLEGARVSSANRMYVVVNEEGYKPYRRQIVDQDVRGGNFTIYLEPENLTAEDAGGGALSVDLRQLQAEIPEAASREYEDALEASADGNHERAAEALERAVELAPDYYDAWIDLGGQYDRLERFADAESAYLEASAVNPAGSLAPQNLGALYYQRGERQRAGEDPAGMESYALASEWLEKAVELNPFSVDSHFFLGAAYYRLNLYDRAEEMLQTTMALDEGYDEARLLLINVYARQGRYEPALEQANAFLERNPDAPEREAIERVRTQLEEALGR